MNFKIYIFDITNPVEITQGATPEFIEVRFLFLGNQISINKLFQRGPYVYKETRAKEEINYFEEQDRASYSQRSLFEFDQENSNGDESDIVTVPNVPVLVSL